MERLMADLNDIEPLDLFDIRMDYRHGPIDQVVAGIRQTLGAEAPEDEPFAPPPERAAARASLQPKPRQPKEPGMRRAPNRPRPSLPRTQKTRALKAAKLAIKATGGNGFRSRASSARPNTGTTKGRPTERRPPGHHDPPFLPTPAQSFAASIRQTDVGR